MVNVQSHENLLVVCVSRKQRSARAEQEWVP